MADYNGNTCPVCNNKFKEGDDIVVCPDCGTPYHRICWNKAGACVHAAEHATGFEWKPDKIADTTEDAVCPNCGTHNPLGAKFCNHCGVPLPAATPTDTAPGADAGARPLYTNGGDRTAAGQPHIDAFTADDSGVYRREVGPEDPIGGIKARDWASYIGNSSLYYLMQFFRMEETKRKVSISFSALFLGPIYFFYRKMWKEGTIFTVLGILLSLPYFILLLVASESPLVAGMATGWIIPAINVCSIAEWALVVIRSLFAVYWYKRDCAAGIQAVYDAIPEGPARNDALCLRGGVSIPGVAIYLAINFVLGAALYAAMGPNLNAVLTALTM